MVRKNFIYCITNSGGGSGDGTGVYYNWIDHAYEDANGNFVGWDWVNASFVQPNLTATYTVDPGMKVYFYKLYGSVQAIIAMKYPGQPILQPGGGYDFSNLNPGDGGATFLSFLLDDVGQAGGGDDFSLVGMYLHFQFGGHKPMTINMSSMDFSGTSQRELGLTGMKPGNIQNVNLFKAGPFFPPALAFGNVRMMYLGNDQFTIVGDKNSRFDFSPLVGGSSLARDAGNVLGAYINYNIWAIPISPLLVFPPLISGPYDVNFVGITTIPK